jgi:hypothetical protein
MLYCNVKGNHCIYSKPSSAKVALAQPNGPVRSNNLAVWWVPVTTIRTHPGCCVELLLRQIGDVLHVHGSAAPSTSPRRAGVERDRVVGPRATSSGPKR